VDGGLALPDFRAAERTFQLLTQVAGRAGRGDKGGRVLIQSYHPDHYALEYAREQNYEKFYEREITFRSGMHFPPLVALINLVIHHQEYNTASQLAADVARLLREGDTERRLRVLGPALAPLARLRGEHRFQILIKTANRRVARETLDRVMISLRSDGQVPRDMTIEVDPINLM
jgi:primosomal protein N' (replication factor Y)